MDSALQMFSAIIQPAERTNNNSSFIQELELEVEDNDLLETPNN